MNYRRVRILNPNIEKGVGKKGEIINVGAKGAELLVGNKDAEYVDDGPPLNTSKISCVNCDKTFEAWRERCPFCLVFKQKKHTPTKKTTKTSTLPAEKIVVSERSEVTEGPEGGVDAKKAKKERETAVKIPDSLVTRLEGLGSRFIRVKGKRPFDLDWPNNAVTAKDSKLQNWLLEGNNYGVVGGNKLLIIDLDDPEVYASVQKILPETFTVESGGKSKGKHLYFHSSESGSYPLIDENGENVGHFKGKGGQVVGPGCIHLDTGDKYRILYNIPIAHVTPRFLRKTFSAYLKRIRDTEKAVKQRNLQTDIDISIMDVVSTHDLRWNGREYQGPHPLHGSTSSPPKKESSNFAVNPQKNIFHCFACQSGGGPLEYLAIDEGFIRCDESRSGVLRGELFLKVVEVARARNIIKTITKITPPKTEPIEYGSQEKLYLIIRRFLEDHVDLVEETEYDVLTAKVLESWLINKFDQVSYVFFLGPPRSGKTRALETMAALCYNPQLAATMSAAAIYRVLDTSETTLFLDEIQQYLQDDKTTFLAILNAGQRRGQKALLVVRVGDDYEVKGFEVFSPKFLASTELTTTTLSTRCITISMIKNAKRIPLRIDRERAKKIVQQLTKYKEDTQSTSFKTEFSQIEKRFIERGFTDYRNIEAFFNLVCVVPPKFRNIILNYAKAIDEQIAEEDGINFYSKIYTAIENAYENIEGGKVSVDEIATNYNLDVPEREMISNRSMGSHIIVMGLRRKCRMSDGKMGRYISEKIMARLKRRYKPGSLTEQTSLVVEENKDKPSMIPSGPSVTSEPSETTRDIIDKKGNGEEKPRKEAHKTSVTDWERDIRERAEKLLMNSGRGMGSLLFETGMRERYGINEAPGKIYEVLMKDPQNRFVISRTTIHLREK